VLTPDPGEEVLVVGLKAVLAVGWFLIGWWQVRQLFGRRWRFLVGPMAAWGWLYLVGTLLGQHAFINWGP
jgi:hypothetical protein